jgi:hypothetical protein
MTIIKINDTEFKYITAKILWNTLNFNKIIVLPSNIPDSMLDKLSIGSDTRIILLPYISIHNQNKSQWPLEWPSILFWNKEVDLNKLDEKVINNAHTDADFENSIITRIQKTYCRNCNNSYLTLIIDADLCYLFSPNYYKEKKKSFKIYVCPNCRNSLRQEVVKFLGSAEPFEGEWYRQVGV